LSIYGRIKDYLIRALSVTDEKAWNPSLWRMYGTQSLSGEIVNENTALTYSAVYNAISLIAGTIGSIPCHLMQQKDDKNRFATDRKMYKVLHHEYNPYMTAMAGRECLAAHALSWGNGYAEIVRNGLGELVELWPITPNRVTPEVDEEGEIIYRVRVDSKDIYFPRQKILHVPGLGFDGYLGYSVISMAAKSIGLSMALETFGSLYFAQGTHPGVVVSHPNKLSDPAHEHLKTSLSEGYSGLGKSHRLLLLEEGMKLEKLGIPPEDSQFLESRQFQIPEIARWYNLPPHKLKDLTRSSFNNIESEQISFVRDTIQPWLVRFEQNYDMQLLTTSDKELSGRGRLYYKHNIKGLLRGDTKAQGEFYTQMFNIGVFSVNDIRRLEDLDPVPGGDKRFVPMNMTPLEDAGRELVLDSPKPTPALPPGNGEDKDDAARRQNR
jgi:HK97 family phage portal protein